MPDDESKPVAKRGSERWVVPALALSGLLLGWVVWQQLQRMRAYDEIDAKIEAHMPQGEPRAATPIPRLLIGVLNQQDGFVQISFEGRHWMLPPRDAEGHDVARQRMQAQLPPLLKERAATMEVPRAEIQALPAPRSGDPDLGTLLVLDAVLAAGLQDVVFADLRAAEAEAR